MIRNIKRRQAMPAPVFFENQSWQWQKKQADSSYADIKGATGRSYTTPVLTAEDDGSDYRCVCKPENSTLLHSIDVKIVVRQGDTAGVGDLPKTGDPSMLMGWAALLSASAAGLVLRRKKN